MKEDPTEYYLSIVATTRNDNHGGDQIKRASLFVRGLIHQCNKFKMKTELVIVEWNPPENKPLLKEVLPLPGKKDFLTLRFIVVPNSVHNKLAHSRKLPLFQMIAKNVGIRRTNGKFILCTNVDLLFSDALFRFLKKKTLKSGTYYRCNRCDIPKDIDYQKDINQLLAFAKKNVISRMGKIHSCPNIEKTTAIYFQIPILAALIGKMKGIYDIFFPGNETTKLLTQIKSIDVYTCGDFTLMSADDWHTIEGYAEFEAYSIHIDSLALISAIALGFKQVILPHDHCTYHISHEDGWDQADPIRKLFQDIDRPMLDWSTVQRAALHLIKKGVPLKVNNPLWGFSDIEFQEYIFTPQTEET